MHVACIRVLSNQGLKTIVEEPRCRGGIGVQYWYKHYDTPMHLSSVFAKEEGYTLVCQFNKARADLLITRFLWAMKGICTSLCQLDLREIASSDWARKQGQPIGSTPFAGSSLLIMIDSTETLLFGGQAF